MPRWNLASQNYSWSSLLSPFNFFKGEYVSLYPCQKHACWVTASLSSRSINTTATLHALEHETFPMIPVPFYISTNLCTPLLHVLCFLGWFLTFFFSLFLLISSLKIRLRLMLVRWSFIEAWQSEGVFQEICRKPVISLFWIKMEMSGFNPKTPALDD